MKIRQRQKSRMNSISLRLPLLTFSLIFALFSSTSGVQVCENGTYPRQLPDKTTPSAEETTSSLPMTTAPDCTPCNSTVPFCYNCRVSTANEVNCTECFAGYQSTHDGRNCSIIGGSHSSWFVGLAVGVVVGVVVVVGLVILVVCLVRGGKCSATTTPPPCLPDPEHLANSYKVNKQNSVTGQRRDHRYAKEPGPTSPRVESVQYDGVKVDFPNESSPYVNCPGVTSTANAKRKTKASEREKEEEEDDDDEVYVNSPPQQIPSSRRSKANPSARGDPGPKKPKPQRKQKDGGAQGQGHAQTEAPSKKSSAKVKRASVFPPDDDSPEQVYCNEPHSDEDEEDYVNADVTQMRAGR